MQKVLIMLPLSFLSLWNFQQSSAQTKKENQKQEIIKKDSLKKDVENQDTIQMAMHPVKNPVTYQAHGFSTPPDYQRLRTPLLSNMGIGDNNLSENEKAQLESFIKNYYLRNSKYLKEIRAKASPYFSLMTKVLDQYNLPTDLKYLAVIESGLNNHARSYVGAVGSWQFMPATARLLGLTVNASQDDRKNLYKSTVAAAKYLSQLYTTFGNWMLVIAAYNSGPVRVKQAISSSGSTRFWDLKKYLPRESQQHVLKFLATTYLMESFSRFFGVDPSDIQLGAGDLSSITPTDQQLASIRLSGKYSLAVIAKQISMDLIQLEQLNPGLVEKFSNDFSQPHTLYLPADKMILFKAKQNDILNESVALTAENNQHKAIGRGSERARERESDKARERQDEGI